MRKLENCLDYSRSALRTTLNDVKGRRGWYHTLRDKERLGHVATAQGILSCRHLGIGEADGVEQIILDRFIELEDYGGWSYLTTVSQTPLVDATAWCVLALKQLDGAGQLDALRGRIVALFERASCRGGFGAFVGDSPRTYHTAMALRALVELLPRTHGLVQDVVAWLHANCTDSNGWCSWGRRPGEPPEVAHTAHVLVSLGALGALPGSREQAMIDGGTAWLANCLKRCTASDVMHDIEEQIEVGRPEDLRRVVIRHCGYAWGAIALAKHSKYPERVRELTRRTLSRFDADRGRWVDGRVGQETMWCLHDNSFALILAKGAVADFGLADVLRRPLVTTVVLALLACAGIVLAVWKDNVLFTGLVLPLVLGIGGGYLSGRLLELRKDR